MLKYRNINQSPVKVLEEIDRLARGEGSWFAVADALNSNPVRLQEVMEWYTLHMTEPFDYSGVDRQTLVNLLLLHYTKVAMVEIIRLKKEIKRLTTYGKRRQ